MKAAQLLSLVLLALGFALPEAWGQPAVELNTNFPGGGLRVIRNDGPVVEVAPDLRGGRPWFYWYFEAEALRPGKVTFRFPEKVGGFKKGAVGFQGPAVSEDGGQTWAWHGSNDEFASAREFSWDFGEAGDRYRFAVAVPYVESNLDRFLQKHRDNAFLETSILAKTRKGREVELLRIGKPGYEGREAMLITVRHHACETMASYLMEGLMEAAIGDSVAGRAFRERHVLYVVPFVDKDGVEEGDQGKNRFPHDHNRDYDGEPLYASVAAIKKLGREKKIQALLDLHCPTLVMDIHQRFYFVGPADFPEGNLQRVESFAARIKELLPAEAPAGPVVQLKPSDAKRAKHCSGYFSRLPGAWFSATLETPFAPKKTSMSPDDVRRYGEVVLAAWVDAFLLE